MRLWHIDLIEKGLLPKSQLLAQWRELNSIFKNQNKHILINYVYDYPKSTLKSYADKVIAEMLSRSFKIVSLENYNEYFKGVVCEKDERFDEHNEDYYTMCFWNLKEKYVRGQKDFDDKVWSKLRNDYMGRVRYD